MSKVETFLTPAIIGESSTGSLMIGVTLLNELRHEKTCFAICEQQMRRSACASAQSDRRLCCSLPG